MRKRGSKASVLGARKEVGQPNPRSRGRVRATPRSAHKAVTSYLGLRPLPDHLCILVEQADVVVLGSNHELRTALSHNIAEGKGADIVAGDGPEQVLARAVKAVDGAGSTDEHQRWQLAELTHNDGQHAVGELLEEDVPVQRHVIRQEVCRRADKQEIRAVRLQATRCNGRDLPVDVEVGHIISLAAGPPIQAVD